MTLQELLQKYEGILSRTSDRPMGDLQKLTWLLKAGLVSIQEYSVLLDEVRS